MKQIASPALTQPVLSLLEAGISRNMAGALSTQELFWGHRTSHFGAGMVFLFLGFTASDIT